MKLQISAARTVLCLSACLAIGVARGAAQTTAAEAQARNLITVVTCKLGGTERLGSGILLGAGPDRVYILTANHTVRRGLEQAENLRVQFRWLAGERVPAALLDRFEPNLDVAVLRVAGVRPPPNLRFDCLGDPGSVSSGAPVYSVGHPNGNLWEMSAKPDTVSRKYASRIYFQSAFLAPGHSGGALLNEKRELIGMLRGDQPPHGEAVDFAAILEWAVQVDVPVQLARSGSVSDLAALEAQIGDDVQYQCIKLAVWPGSWGGGKVEGEAVLKALSAPLTKVEENPRLAGARSATLAGLYRCVGGAHLIRGGAELPQKISSALPYLRKSLEADPGQTLLANNISNLELFLANKGGQIRPFLTNVLQVLRGGDDPKIPELVDRMAGVAAGRDYQAQQWLLHTATSPSLWDYLKMVQLMIKKEKGLDLAIDVSSKSLPGGLVEVQAKIGPNVFLWHVDYEARKYQAANDFTKSFMTSIVQAKP